MIFQWVFAAVFCAALLLTWRRVRQRVFRFMEGLFWTFVWGAGLVLIWRPEATNLLANTVGIGRGVDFILYVAVIGLFFSIFLLALAHDRLERQMTKLVQQQALEQFRQRYTRS